VRPRRHRAVEVDRHLRKPPAPEQLEQHVDHLLGAADREGRHEHHSPAGEGPLRRLRQFLVEVFRLVRAVAVSGLDDQDVAADGGRRIGRQGRVVAATSPLKRIVRYPGCSRPPGLPACGTAAGTASCGPPRARDSAGEPAVPAPPGPSAMRTSAIADPSKCPTLMNRTERLDESFFQRS